MLHLESDSVRASLWSARFGLEREALRVTRDGRMSRTPHPFPQDDPRIVRDFCENQTEINTGVSESAAAAVAELEEIDARLRAALAALPEPETLWLGSNPPPLGREEDIPAARFTGARAGKTAYREYAAARYGRRKMCFCGVHVNLSFGPDLLAADFAAAGGAGDPRRHADALYCELTAKAADRIWLLVALMAASPLADPSLFGLGGPAGGAPLFCGFASLRCSELGFWNDFVPVFDYSDAPSYARSIARYVEAGLIAAPTELYYPVRVKPRGPNRLDLLAAEGVDRIELRTFDVVPFAPAGVDARDVAFAHAWLLRLAALPRTAHPAREQDYDFTVSFREIDPVSGTESKPKFRHTLADGLCVAEISKLHTPNTDGYANPRLTVLQSFIPLHVELGLLYCFHGAYCSIYITAASIALPTACAADVPRYLVRRSCAW